MKSNNPIISVFVITYNQEATIARTLDSILVQKHPYSMEVVIGEDCSTDKTRVICETYVTTYPDIFRLLDKEENKGVVRNVCDTLKECRGKYLAGCAGDDWWHNPNKLKLQVQFLERNPLYGLVHSDVDFYLTDKSKTIKSINKTNKTKVPSGDFAINLLAELLPIFTPTPCYRKELLKYVDFDRYLEQGFLMEDLPMWLDMCRVGKFYYIDESLATYTIHEGSMCRPLKESRDLEFLQSITKVQKYYQNTYFKTTISPEAIDYANLKRIFFHKIKFGKYFEAFKLVRQLQKSSNPLIRIFVSILGSNYLIFYLVFKAKQLFLK